MDSYAVYTDGACSGNPGPGGWAAIVLDPRFAEHSEISGGSPDTTNNVMELTAAIEGLKATPKGAKVTVYADSQYVIKGITEWIYGWMRNGWKSKGGSKVKNMGLWKKLWEQDRQREVTWVWVKGHADNEFNNLADKLAVEQRDLYG